MQMLSLLAMEPKKIKNIAFDLGGVVLALSLEGAIKGFERTGRSFRKSSFSARKLIRKCLSCEK